VQETFENRKASRGGVNREGSEVELRLSRVEGPQIQIDLGFIGRACIIHQPNITAAIVTLIGPP